MRRVVSFASPGWSRIQREGRDIWWFRTPVSNVQDDLIAGLESGYIVAMPSCKMQHGGLAAPVVIYPNTLLHDSSRTSGHHHFTIDHGPLPGARHINLPLLLVGKAQTIGTGSRVYFQFERVARLWLASMYSVKMRVIPSAHSSSAFIVDEARYSS